ncbi:Uncharacterised protein [Sphingobacterium spiritivorum]|uniref:SH3 domain-containing protein n=1 Tax=Sphingobacterium spiritivorum TaxID=258 RepID=A0A380BJJ8_SPHSI|nr:hypothetical protein [Sphingobacterium spiritivorum]SUJ01433.1 Uncharacterised protein [Sphingobacterium spiritivorum]
MKAFISLLFSLILFPVFAQTGTYRRKDKTGASCTIAVQKNQSLLKGQIFAWWNTSSDTHGVFNGQGVLNDNICTLRTQEESACSVRLSFSKNALNALFSDCNAENLPEDFAGNYIKITSQIPGEYLIKTAKAYFYKTAKSNSRLRTYLIKGDKVYIDLENIIDDKWVFVNYTNISGKVSSGYMLWQAFNLKP